MKHFPLFIKLVLVLSVAVLASLQMDAGDNASMIVVTIIWLIGALSFTVEIVTHLSQLRDISRAQSQIESQNDAHSQQLKEIAALTEKLRTLETVSEQQLKATFYTQELSQPASKFQLLISLNAQVSFEELCPFLFAIELKEYRKEKKLEFGYLVEDSIVTSVETEKRLSSYQHFNVSDEGKCTPTFLGGVLHEDMNNILIEIFPSIQKIRLRDFHDEKLFLYVPEKLLAISDSISFIVNGWAIIHQDVQLGQWRRFRVSDRWKDFKHKDLELMFNWPSDFRHGRYGGWIIDLYSAIPPKLSGERTQWPS